MHSACDRKKKEKLIQNSNFCSLSLSEYLRRLGLCKDLEAVTEQYVDVRLERKKSVLEVYHKALHPPKSDGEKKQGDSGKEEKPKKKVVI
ncbi:MAG: hypothetical protein PUE85_10145 [Firmicutes bacterium]|nr:hypothetical protein [Bacillota bacterium]